MDSANGLAGKLKIGYTLEIVFFKYF